MSKLFNWAAARIVAAFAFALPLAAMAAPTATAVWRSNLGQSYTIGGDVYALKIYGAGTDSAAGILNLDGTVTVTNEWTGWSSPCFEFGSDVTSISVLVKFSGFAAVTDDYGACLAAMRDSSGNEVGAYVAKGETSLSAFYKANGSQYPTQGAVADSGNAVVENGYMLFSYSTGGGVKVYMGSAIADLVGGGVSNYKYGNKTIKRISIGGDADGLYYTPTGFTIEDVALFVGSSLTASDVADYVFPTVTVDTTATMTMTELNTKVAAFGENTFNYFSSSPVVTYDVAPSAATTNYLQNALWNGTVFIKDQNIVNLDPTIYGNPNSTLKLSGVSGHWGAAVYEKTATPAIELEDSETEGKEYGYYASNGYSFFANGKYYYVHTPELKGSGTYKANTTGNGALFVADKFDNFTGKLDLEGKTVWLGTGAPTKSADTWNNLVNFPGTVRLGSTIPANYSTWNVPNGYKGTVVLTAAASEQYQVNFLTSSTWKGTCQLNWNATGKLDIVNYGNANSVIEIPSTFSALPTQNGGSDGAEVDAEVKIIGSWTVSDGWDNQTTTFAKLSGAGTLTVNGSTSGETAIPYTITRLEGFTGTLAGLRGQFTIGTIVSAGEPTPGTKLVNCTATKPPVLDSTKVVYNDADQDVDLEFKAGDGIYVALPPSVTITVPVVANTTIEVSVGGETVAPATEGESSNTYSVADGATVTVTYTSDGYEVTGGTFEFTASEGYTVDATNVTTRQYIAYVVFQQESGQSFIDVTNNYTTVSNAIDAAKAMKKTVVLIAQPEATDTYNISAGETINVKKGEFTFDGIIFPEGSQYINTTTETAGVTQYKCAVYTATVQYPGQEPVSMTGQLIQILGGLYSGYVPAYAGTVVTVLDGSDATVGDAMPEVFVYDSEAHTYTLKTMVASINTGAVDIYYPTISNAFEAVVSGQTIKVLCDNTSNVRSVRVKEGTTVTLDLNGFTVTGPSGDNPMFWLENNSNFVVTDTSEDKAGKLVSEASKVVWSSNRCTFTLTAGTLESGNMPIYIYEASAQSAPSDTRVVNVNGGKLICKSANEGDACIVNTPGRVYVTGGVIESTVRGIRAVISEISGGTVKVGNSVFYNDDSFQVVTGGTFNKDVSKYVPSSGYEILNNGDGTYTVRRDNGWMYAAPGYWDYTGTWTEGATLGDDKVTFSDGATYSNRTASAGQLVTVAMTLSFDDVNDDEDGYEGAKAAIRLGAGETEGAYVFQLYTSESSTPTWKSATGFSPVTNTDYNIVFVLDLTNKTYTASIVSGATTNALSVGGSTTIAFANQNNATPVQQIDFVGSGTVSSIEGSYEDAPVPEGFVENDEVTLSDGTATLTAAQATWLNQFGVKLTVAARLEELSSAQFTAAYLLNLDILDPNSDYTFAVKGIVVGENKVDVTVTLTRTGALTENEKAKPIVGTLKLKGTATLGTAFTVLGEAAVEFDANADFGDGATETTVTVDTTETDAKFYRPVIE